MSQSREKLIKELDSLPYHNIGPDCKSVSPRISLCTSCLADFILADRLRVVKPLAEAWPSQGSLRPRNINEAICKTLRNAGVKI